MSFSTSSFSHEHLTSSDSEAIISSLCISRSSQSEDPSCFLNRDGDAYRIFKGPFSPSQAAALQRHLTYVAFQAQADKVVDCLPALPANQRLHQDVDGNYWLSMGHLNHSDVSTWTVDAIRDGDAASARKCTGLEECLPLLFWEAGLSATVVLELLLRYVFGVGGGNLNNLFSSTDHYIVMTGLASPHAFNEVPLTRETLISTVLAPHPDTEVIDSIDHFLEDPENGLKAEILPWWTSIMNEMSNPASPLAAFIREINIGRMCAVWKLLATAPVNLEVAKALGLNITAMHVISPCVLSVKTPRLRSRPARRMHSVL